LLATIKPATHRLSYLTFSRVKVRSVKGCVGRLAGCTTCDLIARYFDTIEFASENTIRLVPCHQGTEA